MQADAAHLQVVQTTPFKQPALAEKEAALVRGGMQADAAHLQVVQTAPFKQPALAEKEAAIVRGGMEPDAAHLQVKMANLQAAFLQQAPEKRKAIAAKIAATREATAEKKDEDKALGVVNTIGTHKVTWMGEEGRELREQLTRVVDEHFNGNLAQAQPAAILKKMQANGTTDGLTTAQIKSYRQRELKRQRQRSEESAAEPSADPSADPSAEPSVRRSTRRLSPCVSRG